MTDLVKIAVMGLNEAKDFQNLLEQVGISTQLNHDDQTCTRGCAVTVELMANESDVPKIQQIYTQQFNKLLQGLKFDPNVVNSVYDTSQEEATCPACGHGFKTTETECPDCGLVLG